MDSLHSKAADDQNDSGPVLSVQRRQELADFLRSRREKINPSLLGIPRGTRRRTPGLRREEVAERASVGATWYTWLEQARDIQPSADVLKRLAVALMLNPAETRHLFSLAGKTAPVEFESFSEKIPESLLGILNDAVRVPAVVIGTRWDLLALNEPAKKLFPAVGEYADGAGINWLSFIFSESMKGYLGEHWEAHARRLLAEFRTSVGDSMDCPWIIEIIEKMKAEHPRFAEWWREHDVRDMVAAHPVEIIDVATRKRSRFVRTAFRMTENPAFCMLVFNPVKGD